MHPNDGFPSARALRIGAAAVAGVIVLLAGLVIGRATANSSSAPATSGGSAPPSVVGIPAWATGATRMDHGVPVGYAHTQEGAVAAARNYDLALSATPLALDPQAYRDAATFLDVPSVREQDAARIERSLAAAANLITATHQGHAARAVPFVLTTRLVSYSGDDAQVVVWGGVVFAADGVLSPRLSVSESTYSLHWLGDWRVADDAGSVGPGVMALTTSAQTDTLPAELSKDFHGVGDAAP